MDFLIKDKKFYKSIFVLMFPLMLQQLLRISVDTINSIMLGNVNQIQMSAVSQADQIFFIFYALCNGFSAGCCVLVSQYWGVRNREKIKTIIATGMRGIALFASSFALAVFFKPEFFMRIYSSDPQIITNGASYLRLTSLMYIPCALSVMTFAVCRGVEQVKIVFATNIFSYSVNIFLDYALLFGKFGFPQLGIEGVAIGMVVARLVELGICSYFLYRLEENIGFRFLDLQRKDIQLRNDIFKVGVPILAHEIVWAVGTTAGSMITGHLSKEVVAGFNVNVVLYHLLATVGNGFMHSCSVIMGKTLGTNEKERAAREAKTMLVMGVGFGCLLGLITFVSRDAFLSLYSISESAETYAKQFMLVMAFIWPFSFLEMTGMIAILRAGGEGKIGFYTDIVAMWLTTIPLAFMAAFHWNVAPVWIILIIKMCIVIEALVGLVRVLSMKWIKNLTHQAENRL